MRKANQSSSEWLEWFWIIVILNIYTNINYFLHATGLREVSIFDRRVLPTELLHALLVNRSCCAVLAHIHMYTFTHTHTSIRRSRFEELNSFEMHRRNRKCNFIHEVISERELKKSFEKTLRSTHSGRNNLRPKIRNVRKMLRRRNRIQPAPFWQFLGFTCRANVHAAFTFLSFSFTFWMKNRVAFDIECIL